MIFLYWVYISRLEKVDLLPWLLSCHAQLSCFKLLFCSAKWWVKFVRIHFYFVLKPCCSLDSLASFVALPGPIRSTCCNTSLAFGLATNTQTVCSLHLPFLSLLVHSITISSITKSVKPIIISFLDHCNRFEESIRMKTGGQVGWLFVNHLGVGKLFALDFLWFLNNVFYVTQFKN